MVSGTLPWNFQSISLANMPCSTPYNNICVATTMAVGAYKYYWLFYSLERHTHTSQSLEHVQSSLAMAASNSMASPAFALLLAMVFMLVASGLAQGLAPTTTQVSPAPSPSSQDFCPPTFDNLQAYDNAAKSPGDQSLYVFIPVLGTGASGTSMMAGILSQYPSTWKLCLCTSNPLSITEGSPQVICAFYYGSVTV